MLHNMQIVTLGAFWLLLYYTRWECPWTPHLVLTCFCENFRASTLKELATDFSSFAVMARMHLQNRFSFLADQSPRDDDDVTMPEQERGQATSWEDLPVSIEQALTQLKSSYQRRHHLDAPLGFDDTGELWQWPPSTHAK